MNLKESFHYQNYLTSLFNSMLDYLRDKRNLVHVNQEHLRKNANPDAQDETIDASQEREYAYPNDKLIDFTIAVMNEKHALALAIGEAKAACAVNIDAETTVNTMRRNIIAALDRMCAIKSTERKIPGNDFKFNATGEQVRYYYDIKETTTIDFDRTKAKGLTRHLSSAANEVSALLDRCMIDVDVKFQPLFNVGDSLDDALEIFAGQEGSTCQSEQSK